jgi:hypothetical protein
MECNFVEKAQEFVELFYSDSYAIGGQGTMTTFEASDEMTKTKSPHNTKFFSIDWIKKTCWKEMVLLGMK